MSSLKYDPLQTKLTDYYELVNEIDLLSRSNPDVMKAFNNANEERRKMLGISPSGDKLEFKSFFQQIISNAEKNALRHPHGRRHSEVVKKFATSLFLYAGSMAYSLVQQNMPTALPCLRTVQESIHAEYHPLSEGQFRFDELVGYLEKFDAPLVIAISEDATRVIGRVEYDSETNRLVGFVLPCNSDGLPLADSFLAVSLEIIEECFKSQEISKFAYVFMAQCILQHVPAFCLGCIGSNNCFDATDVLKRWQYIFSQCQKRNINVISFGGDGDSRLLRAMKISSNFKVKTADASHFQLSPSYLTTEIPNPKQWTWFWFKKSTPVLYIQDFVHVAVKLKARLLKPSVILPLGNFLAGSHHLKFLLTTFTKDQHGIRHKDLEHKDKQNFEAVSRITTRCVFDLLEQVPDAKGTMHYLKCMQYFVDAYLNKKLTPLERIHKAWYTIFFFRYWHRWLLLSKNYNIRNNFITHNASSCIELNGHSLILLLLIMRDQIPNGNNHFLPWLLGSQACEQTFRAARSMTSTFSTIINFSMLGFLRRLHRLQIQMMLESEIQETGIKYPRVIAHEKKVGYEKMKEISDLKCITDEDIITTINEANKEAINAITELGMVFSEKELKDMISRPLEENGDNDEDDDDDGDDDRAEVDQDGKGAEDENKCAGDQEKKCVEDQDKGAKDQDKKGNDNLLNDITVMQQVGIIEESTYHTLKETYKRTDNCTVPLYIKLDCNKKQQQQKFSPFVEVNQNGKVCHIRKTTAVWLFQECERVSTDRLFRVRSKQPYSSNNTLPTNLKSSGPQVSTLPQRRQSIQIGDICVFNNQRKWKIGKVLHFCHHEGKTQKARQCSQTSFDLTVKDKGVAVVCSWFSWHPPLSLLSFSLGSNGANVSQSCSISDYAFTLSSECFELLQTENPVDSAPQGILMNDAAKTQLMCAKVITLSNESLLYIEKNLLQITSNSDLVSVSKLKPDNRDAVTTGNKSNIIWKKYGCFALTNLHKAHLCSDHLLDDIHMGAAQGLIKKQFPHLGGLQNTVMQNSEMLKSLNGSSDNLQIVHVELGQTDHWVLMSTVGCPEGEVDLYDSLQHKPSLDTQTVIARYLRSSSSSIRIKLINVAMQKGSTDCGLYAIAMMTSIAFKQDPECIVYDHNGLRLHLKECFDKGIIEPFPISKKRRIKNRIVMEEVCLIYCLCRLPEPEDGSKMIGCDGCMEWFHQKCLSNSIPFEDLELDTWLCDKCRCEEMPT